MVATEENVEATQAKSIELVEKDEAAPVSLITGNMEENEDDNEEEEWDEEGEDDDDEEDLEEEKVNKVNSEETEKPKEENAFKEKHKEPESKKKAEEPKSKEEDKKKDEEPKKTIESDKDKKSNKKKKEKKDSAANNGESSSKKKGSKRVESMGMVFMCSSKTKADCFRYKILGLPETKKDQVLKIYRGMRLFLFDVDLRLMYGIFKAAGPGGYNIEPEAFKSEFPSQVRFTVLDDCLPLAEEIFKGVIKENYYSRNKFEGVLKGDQVKRLCKLFLENSRGGSRSKSRRSRPVGTRRAQLEEISRNQSRTQEKRKRRARDEERRPRSPPPREKRRYTEYVRDDDRRPVLYDREPRYRSPPPVVMHSPTRLYAYERPPLDILPPYIRDEPPAYHIVERDPYLASREPPPLYRDPVYAMPPEYHQTSRDYRVVPTPEYRVPGGARVPDYHDAPDYHDVEIGRGYRPSAVGLPEYRSRTHYKY